jgi:hypothetical protein
MAALFGTFSPILVDLLSGRCHTPRPRQRERARQRMDTSHFTGRLLKGEKIVWCGRPAQGLLLTRRDWLLIPFSLFWGGFFVFWERGVLDANAPILMKLWGVPFLLIGVYLVAGRFLLDAWIRRGVYYAVTDKRVLILRSGPFSKFSAVSLDQLPDANLTERADGRGTIRFGTAAPYRADSGFSGWTPTLDSTPQFLAIEDARTVFDHIQRAAMGT